MSKTTKPIKSARSLEVTSTRIQRTKTADWELAVRIQASHNPKGDVIVSLDGEVITEIWNITDAHSNGCFILTDPVLTAQLTAAEASKEFFRNQTAELACELRDKGVDI